MPTMPKGMRPTVAPYTYRGQGGAMRTEVGGGMPRYGLEWDRGVQQYQVTLILAPFEETVWVTFYHRSIAQGTITFDMILDSGYGLQTHAVNIVPGSYSVARTGGNHAVVSFVAEAESTAYALTDDEAQGILDYYDIYGTDRRLIDRIALFANFDTLVLDF